MIDQNEKRMRIKVVPTTKPEDNYCEICLSFKFVKGYPFTAAPTFKVEKKKGLSDVQIKELQELIDKQVFFDGFRYFCLRFAFNSIPNQTIYIQ